MSHIHTRTFLTLMILVSSPSIGVADEAEVACNDSVTEWVSRCAVTSGVELEAVSCPPDHVVIAGRLFTMPSLQIDITTDPIEGLFNMDGFSLSVVGGYGDWSLAPSWSRAPFDAVAACLASDPELGVVSEDAFPVRPPPPGPVESVVDEVSPTQRNGRARAYWALGAVALFLALFLLSRKNRGRERPVAAIGRAEWFILAALIAAIVATRLPLMVTTSLALGEMKGFAPGMWSRLLEAGTVVPPVSVTLTSIAFDGWGAIGDHLGCGGELLWLRLPNLALTIWLLLIFLRVGRLVGAREAGWAAAILFLLLPRTITLSVCHGDYFVEAVLSAWFIERLATYLVEGRPVFPSLTAAGAFAVWSGNTGFLVVVPGLLLFLVVAWRREERFLPFTALLLFVALSGPRLVQTIEVGLYHLTSFRAPYPAHVEWFVGAEMGGRDPSERGFDTFGLVTFPYRCFHYLMGALPGLLATVALFFLGFRRRWFVLYPFAVMVLFAVFFPERDPVWHANTFSLCLLLFLAPWGLSTISDRRWTTSLLVILVLLGLAYGIATASQGRFPHDARQDWELWLSEDTEEDVSRMLRDRSNRETPVLVLDRSHTLLITLCEDRSTRRNVLACVRALDGAEGVNGSRVGEILGRPAIRVEYSLSSQNHGMLCAGLGDTLARSPWSDAPFYVLSWWSIDAMVLQYPACAPLFSGYVCTEEADGPGLVLSFCRHR